MFVSIAIPTYNRKQIVYDKVLFILDVIRDSPLSDSFELLVVDNASTDGTYDELSRLLSKREGKFKIFKNSSNIGLVGNCLKCIELATGKYIWIIGDDDNLDVELFNDINEILGSFDKDINILHLNHRCIDKIGGPVIIESFYGYRSSAFSEEGKNLFNDLISKNHTGGFMFISANILNRQKALSIIKNTGNREKKMLAYPMYLNSCLALTGPFYYFSEIRLSCIYNQSSWIDKYIYLNTVELPSLWIKLHNFGLSIDNLKYLVFQHSFLYAQKHILSRAKEYLLNYTYIFENLRIDSMKFILKMRLFLIFRYSL